MLLEHFHISLAEFDILPYRACIPLPYINTKPTPANFVDVLADIMIEFTGDWFSIDARFAHSNNVIRNTLPTHCRVLDYLLVQQSKCLGSLHCYHRVFPDYNLRMIDKASLLI